jgi:hypothetical protein
MLVTHPNPIPELQHALLPPQSATSQGACPDSLLFHYFQFGFTFESIKELGSASKGKFGLNTSFKLPNIKQHWLITNLKLANSITRWSSSLPFKSMH